MAQEVSVAATGEITTNTGRQLQLLELAQRLTYEGLLEGLPTRRRNKVYLDHLVIENREKRRGPVFLLPPIETPLPLPPGETYPFGEPASLPRITCVGRFRSRPTGEGDRDIDYSELVIIWLQAEFALPIDQSVVVEIASVSWETLASNFEY